MAVEHWTKYAANHEWPGVPEKFHKVTCKEIAELEGLEPRGGVVAKDNSPELRSSPNLSYSDSKEALIEQGFTACTVCKP